MERKSHMVCWCEWTIGLMPHDILHARTPGSFQDPPEEREELWKGLNINGQKTKFPIPEERIDE